MPDTLLQDFCPELKNHGGTIGSLADAYVYNTNCSEKYKHQLSEQKQYNDTVLKNGK